ncbi:MAG: hypothetical protein IT300_08090 [Dehalococcoidia bacterium]|nr:hypothetical protein [Dehalococcoidia bacterium]
MFRASLLGAVAFAAALVGLGTASTGVDAAQACATIKGGTITDSVGNVIRTGYDQFGYNYQAHMFNGTYDSSDRVLDGTYWGNTGDFVDDALSMKWSDSWLANVDCNGDGKLDRGLVNGVAGGISLGWLTNHINGDYDSGPLDADTSQDAHFTLFDKIVWVGPGGDLWGQYTIMQEVLNDPAGGVHGLQFKTPTPGFGQNDHWTSN